MHYGPLLQPPLPAPWKSIPVVFYLKLRPHNTHIHGPLPRWPDSAGRGKQLASLNFGFWPQPSVSSAQPSFSGFSSPPHTTSNLWPWAFTPAPPTDCPAHHLNKKAKLCTPPTSHPASRNISVCPHLCPSGLQGRSEDPDFFLKVISSYVVLTWFPLFSLTLSVIVSFFQLSFFASQHVKCIYLFLTLHKTIL